MLQRLSHIEDLQGKVNSYVDCYVSTDASEVAEFLVEMGFLDTTSDRKERTSLRDVYRDKGYFDLWGESLKDPRTGLEIDCVDIPLEEALGKRKDIDFTPMSTLRVYTNGSPNVVRILLPIMKALDKEKQNMAFMSNSGSTTYVKLSEFY